MLIETSLIEAQDDGCGCISVQDHESSRRVRSHTALHFGRQIQTQLGHSSHLRHQNSFFSRQASHNTNRATA